MSILMNFKIYKIQFKIWIMSYSIKLKGKYRIFIKLNKIFII
jgi:hypothetical protein